MIFLGLDLVSFLAAECSDVVPNLSASDCVVLVNLADTAANRSRLFRFSPPLFNVVVVEIVQQSSALLGSVVVTSHLSSSLFLSSKGSRS